MVFSVEKGREGVCWYLHDSFVLCIGNYDHGHDHDDNDDHDHDDIDDHDDDSLEKASPREFVGICMPARALQPLTHCLDHHQHQHQHQRHHHHHYPDHYHHQHRHHCHHHHYPNHHQGIYK